MKNKKNGLSGIFVDPFLDYLAPHTEDEGSTEVEESEARGSVIDSDKLCLLVFVAALVFVAVISPMLCLGSLFFRLSFEGMWYFWLVTFADLGCLVWRIARRKGKRKTISVKPIDNRATCNIIRLYDKADTTINMKEFGGLHYAKES
ncbi:MAG: hypothetical protein EOM51_03020 [Clostridia bacterium]|nr:hypothetical protein [Clostridia bacterium]